jgi:tetratricopeptide (TPR) repeat protein
VKLQIQIDSDGHVIGSKVVSGPPMLVGAAQDCVKQWVYEKPQVNGKPVQTSALVTISFTLPPPVNPDDEKIAAKFFPIDQACIKAVGTNAAPEQQATTCREAAQVAEIFSPQERFIERRSAFVYASTALRRNKQLSESLEFANKAVAVVEQGHDDGSGSSAAYGTRAQVYAQLGQLEKASDDLSRAEQFERDAIAKMLSDDEAFVKHQYVPVLKSLLNFHSQILTALGNQRAADAKTAEAGQL